MIRWLEGRTAARTMTGVAVTDTTGIVCPGAAYEGCRGVTEVAVETGRNMRGHGIHHTSRRSTVVT